jgi:hypothetical protein
MQRPARDRAWHPYVELHIVVEGSATVHDGKSKREVSTGEMVLVDADPPHGLSTTASDLGYRQEGQMSDQVGENLALIVAAWTDLFGRGSTDSLEALLDAKVVWNGMFADEICNGRGEVLGNLVRFRPRQQRITRIEAEEKGDQVAVSVDGPDFRGDDRRPAGGPRSLVFTFRNGHIIRMQSLKSRDEAFQLVGRVG